MRTLPTVVVGGYLGAGKTTLVNHLLRAADGRRIAVMVNDFGEIGIDADLIASRDGDVMNLAGGCICCSVGSDLIGALVALPARAQPPDLVVIETSGVALPGAVARSARLAPGIEIDGVIVLADAETVQARAADRYVGDTVRQQLRDADLLVLNKVDLVAPAALPALRAWLAEQAPQARVIETVESQVPPEAILGLRDADAQASASPAPAPAFGARLAAQRPAGSVFDSASLTLPAAVDAQALACGLADPALGLVRAKGIVCDRVAGWVVVQVVGARHRVGPLPVAPAAPDGQVRQAEPGCGRLVAIGLRGAFHRAALDTVVAAAQR